MAHTLANTVGPHSMKIQMEHEYQVETLLIQNRESCCSDRMSQSTITVGSSEDASANTPCGGILTESEIFACG